MNVFDYLFSCFSYIINILNHDFFGFGFTYLDFVLAASLSFIILKFLLQGFNEQDRFNFLSLSVAAKDLSHEYQMTHKDRETQIINKFIHNKTTGRMYHSSTERTRHPNGNISIYVNEQIIRSAKTSKSDN